MLMHIFLLREITITGAGYHAAARQADEKNKGVIFKNLSSGFKRKKEQLSGTNINQIQKHMHKTDI